MIKRSNKFTRQLEDMNMSSSNKTRLANLLKATQESLAFDSDEDKANFYSSTVQIDFLSQIQKQLDIKGWSRSDLAKELGVSKSFVSQLFSCDKSFFNRNLIGKLQLIFGQKIYLGFSTSYSVIVTDLSAVDGRLLQPSFSNSPVIERTSTHNDDDFSSLDLTGSKYSLHI